MSLYFFIITPCVKIIKFYIKYITIKAFYVKKAFIKKNKTKFYQQQETKKITLVIFLSHLQNNQQNGA